MKNQDENLKEITRLARLWRNLMPEFKAGYEESNAEAYKDGSLSAKNKRLMAVAVSISQGCTGCMLFQTQAALDLGATKDELLETMAVAVALGGSMASSKTAQVAAFLEQKGIL